VFYCASQAEAIGLRGFEEAVGRREVHVRAGGKSLTVPALVQNRLVHPRLNGRGDAAPPRGDAREASGVAPASETAQWTSEAAPQCRARGPSSGRERGRTVSFFSRSICSEHVPSNSGSRTTPGSQATGHTPANERPRSPTCMPALPRPSTGAPNSPPAQWASCWPVLQPPVAEAQAWVGIGTRADAVARWRMLG
jgi:hypothetical protein